MNASDTIAVVPARPEEAATARAEADAILAFLGRCGDALQKRGSTHTQAPAVGLLVLKGLAVQRRFHAKHGCSLARKVADLAITAACAAEVKP